MTIQIIIITLNLIAVVFPCSTLAWVTGPCANCHTMHASQTPWPDEWSEKSKLPQQYLLATAGSSACVGCHSSATSSTWYDLDGCKVPVVLYTGGEPSSYLAGGNFWWVSPDGGADDTKGHNVFLTHDDLNLKDIGAPGDPGFVTCGGTGANSCHLNLSRPFETAMPGLTGKYGCEGCHLNVKHHANDHPNGQGGLVDSWDKGYYRFLSGHMSGGCVDWPACTYPFGVKGYEDGLWEEGLHTYPETDYQGASPHNEYLGLVQNGNYGFGGGLGYTTTAFCTGCHGEFHMDQHQGDEKATNPWVRHPSDAIIPNTPGSEYADTGGASHLYDPLSPVAKPTVDTTPDTTVSPGTDMVMCLSCHRPHGSPYPDLLRWDYVAQMAGGGGDDKGCFYCHTQKN